MKSTKKLFLVLIPLLLALFILSSCGIIPQTPEGKISGRVLIPPSEISKDITGWVPTANAEVTIVDADGITHTATTDENGYYAFLGIAVNPNTIITATVELNGDTLILKDVIPQAVTADEDYDAGDMDPESTALALLLEALIAAGEDPSDIDIDEIKSSDGFLALVSQVTSVLEEDGDVTKDPDIANMIEDIINSPIPPSPSPTPKPDTTITIAALPGVTAPVALATPVTSITETAQYTGTVTWDPADATFGYNTVYTATITLTIKEGYTFTGVPADFFTVTGATTNNPADSGVITAVFPETGKEPDTIISIAAISGITVPVAGETPVTAITETDEYTGTVTWNPADATFGYSTVYTATITLTVKEGYTITGVAADFFTVTGATTVTNITDSGVVTAVFTETYPPYFSFNPDTRTITDYDKAGGTVVVIPYTIGGIPVEHIGYALFYNMDITSITIPDSVTTIDTNAFRYNHLTSITIPDSVTIIGDFAFDNNYLTDITIPDSVITIGKGAFSNNELISVIITDSVTTIGDHAFQANYLTNITIPNSVTTIGDYAFQYQHDQLTSLTLGTSVEIIGKGAFRSNYLTNITIPNSVTTIGDYAFQNQNNGLTSITIGIGVEIIGEGAFCENELTSITIGAGVTIVDDNSVTMGTNTGFKAVYDDGGKLAGTYNYNDTYSVWEKL